MWHVSSRSGVATLRTVIYLLLTYLHAVCGQSRNPGFTCAIVDVERIISEVRAACCFAIFFAASLLATAVYWQVRGAVLVLLGD